MGKKLFIIISLLFVVILVLSISIWIYFKPFVFVSIDVNPSIEFSVNKFGRVIEVEALNDQGAEILEDVEKNLSNKTIEEAVDVAIERLIRDGYFDSEGTADVIVAAYSKEIKDADALIVKLKDIIKTKIESAGYFARIDGITVDEKTFDEAESMGVSPGKLDLIQDVIDNIAGEGTIKTIDDFIDKPVSEIVTAPPIETDDDLEEVSNDEDDDEDDDEDENESGEHEESELEDD